MRRFLIPLAVILMLCSAARAADVKFATEPSVRKDGNAQKVAFALSAACDVEVAVLNARGAVVRHLAAGVLGGENPPPPPLQAGGYGGGVRFVENALAVYPNLGCLAGNLGDSCVCRQPMFQVDRFGRVFYPNAIDCSVRIVDNAGNLIVQFGRYGNIDSAGPNSQIPTPAIPLGWPQAVGATDGFVYVSDVLNRRIVRLARTFTIGQTCECPVETPYQR